MLTHLGTEPFFLTLAQKSDAKDSEGQEIGIIKREDEAGRTSERDGELKNSRRGEVKGKREREDEEYSCFGP